MRNWLLNSCCILLLIPGSGQTLTSSNLPIMIITTNVVIEDFSITDEQGKTVVNVISKPLDEFVQESLFESFNNFNRGQKSDEEDWDDNFEDDEND